MDFEEEVKRCEKRRCRNVPSFWIDNTTKKLYFVYQESKGTWENVRENIYLGGIDMSFVQISVQDEINKRKQNSGEFELLWKESREEYRLIGEMIHIRKTENITQSQLAELTGSKQQVISRIEKKENSPSLRMFCNMLYALGYELQIVKRKEIL